MAVAAGDFNGDGRADVAAANAGSGNVSVLLNNGVWPAFNAPSVSIIGDPTITEGNTGTLNAVFTVTLSSASNQAVTVNYATADGTATRPAADYQLPRTGTLTIPAGQTSATIAVPVVGDRLAENSETFSLRLTDPTNAFIADGLGLATIVDNEPRISINNVSKSEGNGKTTTFTFTVRLVGRVRPGRDGQLRHRQRHRDGRQRLPGQDRQRDVRAGRDDQDDHDRGQRRQDQGVERDVLRGPLRPE